MTNTHFRGRRTPRSGDVLEDAILIAPGRFLQTDSVRRILRTKAIGDLLADVT